MARQVIAVAEAALRVTHGEAEVQRQQLGHLQVLAELPSVELLIEPSSAAMATWRASEVLDDRVVLEGPEQARHLTEDTVVAPCATSNKAPR